MDRNTVFVLMAGGAPNSPVVFRQIWKIDTSNLPNIAAPVLAGSVPATADCTDADVTPDGKRALFVCSGNTLYDLDLTAGTTSTASPLIVPTPTTVPAVTANQIEIEPTKGLYGYVVLTNGDAVVVDLTGAPVLKLPTIAGGYGGGLRFHPTGKWAYLVPPASSPGSSEVHMLDSSAGPATAYKIATKFGVFGRAGYDILLGGDRAYLLTTWNGNLDAGNPAPPGNGTWVVLLFSINQSSGLLTQNGNAVFLMGTPTVTTTTVNGVTTTTTTNGGSPQGAILPVYPVTVNTNLDPTIFDPLVGIDGFGSATDEYTNPNIPTGQVTITAPASEAEPNNSDIQWRFVSWSDPSLPTTPSAPVTVVAPGGKTYTANYEKWVKITVENTGCSVVNISTDFYKAGSNPLLHVEAVAGGNIMSIEFLNSAVANDTPLAITEPGTLKMTCDPPALGTPVTLYVSPSRLATSNIVKMQIGPSGDVDHGWAGNVAGTNQPLTVKDPNPEIPNDTKYTFANWLNGTLQSNLLDWEAQLLNNGTPQSFTSNFTPVSYYVDIVYKGCKATDILWTNPAGGFPGTGGGYEAAGQALSATLGSAVKSATLEQRDPLSGNFLNPAAISQVSVNLNTPIRLTLDCPTLLCTPAPTGLTGWYAFDETAGPSSASQVTSAPTLNWVGNPTALAVGKVAGAIQFNGSQYLQAASATAFNPGTSNFSFDFWIKAAPNGTAVSLLEKVCGGIIGGTGCSPSTSQGWRIELTAQGRLVMGMGTATPAGFAGAITTNARPVLTDNNWHFVAVTVNRASGVVTYYIDGTAPSKTFTVNFTLPTAGSMTSTLPLRVGANQLGTGNFTGALDELEIFNGTLVSATTFQAIYDADAKGKCKTPAGPTVNVTLNTNLPLGLLSTPPIVSINPPGGATGTGSPTHMVSVPTGNAGVSVSPSSILDKTGNSRFDFKDWSGPGVPPPTMPVPHVSANQPVTVPATAATYTANFDMLNKVQGSVTGSCSVTPAIGSFIVNGSNVTLNVTPATNFGSAVYSAGPGSTSVNLTNGQTFQWVGGTLTVTCTNTTGGGGGPVLNACVQPPPGPGTWWPMESAALPVPDILPLGLNAIASPVAGSALPTAIPGKVGSAFRFNGTNQFLNVPYNAVFDSLRSEDGFTIDAWVKLDGSKDGGAIFGNHRNTGNNGYYFGASKTLGATLYLGAYRNANGYEGFSANLPIPNDGQWHFVAARMRRIRPNAGADPTSTEVTLWVDGAKTVNNAIQPTWDLSTTIDFSENCVNPSGPNGLCWANPVTHPARPILIGTRDASGTTATPQFDGGLDELEFFKRPLTDPEVAGIYNAGTFGKCKPPTVSVTVITNPLNVQAKVGIDGKTSPGIHQDNTLAASSNQTVLAEFSHLDSNGNYHTFQNWTPSAPPVTTPAPPAGSVAGGVTLPATGNVTYTANYAVIGYQVDATGCGITVGPTSRRIQSNPLVFSIGGTLTLVAGPAPGQTFQDFVVTTGTGLPVSYSTNPVNIPFNGPLKIVANCDATKTITLVSDPAAGPNLTVTHNVNAGGLQLGSTSGTGQGPRNVTLSGGLASLGSIILTAQPQFTANGTGYIFKDFTPGGLTANPASIAPPPPTSTTYTANYTVACYVLTVNTSPAAGGTVAKSPATGVAGFTDCYAPGTTVTLTATPASGQTLSGWTGATPGSGNTATVVMSQPRTVTANFGTATSNVNLMVVSNPPGLGVRIGATGPFASAPISGPVPPNTSAAVAADTPVVSGGIGYRFSSWSGGPTPATTANATVAVGTSNMTVTANYTQACYVVNITTAGTAGSVNPNVLGGGLASGFTNCYTSGSLIRTNFTAGPNQGLKSIVVTQGGTTQTYTDAVNVSISAPTNIVVTFAPKPAMALVAPSIAGLGGTSYTIPVSFSNSNASPGTNVRITSITSTNPGVTISNSLLNFGNLPANGSTGIQNVNFTIPASIPTGTNIVLQFTVEVTNSLGDVFISTPSAGRPKP